MLPLDAAPGVASAYGMRESDVETMLVAQDHKCRACGGPVWADIAQTVARSRFDKITKELLCPECFEMLGKIGPSLRKINRYLARRHMPGSMTWSKVAKLLRYVQ